MSEEWKESIIVPISKNSDKTECGNFRGISPWTITYKHLSNFLPSGLTPNAQKFIGDHLC